MASEIKSTPFTLNYCNLVCNMRTELDKMNSEEELYSGAEIENASDRELLDGYIFLVKNGLRIKQDVEFELLEKKEEIEKYQELLESDKNPLMEIANLDWEEWLVSTNLFQAIEAEIVNRGLQEYADILYERYIYG